MSHDELAGLAAGYALSTLDPQERSEFEGHLAGCEECAKAVAEMAALAQALPLAAGETDPPAGLRGRILSAVRSEAAATSQSNLRSTSGRGGWAVWRRFAFRPAVAAAALAALVVVAVALASWGSQSQDDAATASRRLDITYDGIRIMAEAETWWRFAGTSDAPDAAGTLAYSEEHGAACLVVWGLPIADGNAYQVQLGRDGQPTETLNMWRFESTLWLIIDGDPTELDTLEVASASFDGQPAAALINVPISGP